MAESFKHDRIWLELLSRNRILKLESRHPRLHPKQIASQTGSRVRTSGAPDSHLVSFENSVSYEKLEWLSRVSYDQAYEKTQLPARNAPQFGVRSGMRHFWPVRFLLSDWACALHNQKVPLRFRPSPQKSNFLCLTVLPKGAFLGSPRDRL